MAAFKANMSDPAIRRHAAEANEAVGLHAASRAVEDADACAEVWVKREEARRASAAEVVRVCVERLKSFKFRCLDTSEEKTDELWVIDGSAGSECYLRPESDKPGTGRTAYSKAIQVQPEGWRGPFEVASVAAAV